MAAEEEIKKTQQDSDSAQEAMQRRAERRKELLEYIRLVIIVVGATLLIEAFVVVNAVIPSASMEPTIMTGDHIFGNRLAYKFGEPERFDMIIFRYPDDEEQLFIKRVIGLPGDTVEFRDGDVFINGSSEPLDDSFCSVADATMLDPERSMLDNPFVVPEGCYFVMGDNRLNSRDSRYWQNPFVAEDKILGKAFFRYWPLREISLIQNRTGEGG